MAAPENTVTAAIRARIIAYDAAVYNTRNVIVVPQFMYLPLRFQGPCIQIVQPTVTPTGTGGGAYLHLMTINFGLIYRWAGDPKFEKGELLKRLSDEAHRVRTFLMTYDATVLQIPLYDNGNAIQPRIIEHETNGRMVEDSLFIGWTMWGQYCEHITDMVAVPPN